MTKRHTHLTIISFSSHTPYEHFLCLLFHLFSRVFARAFFSSTNTFMRKWFREYSARWSPTQDFSSPMYFITNGSYASAKLLSTANQQKKKKLFSSCRTVSHHFVMHSTCWLLFPLLPHSVIFIRRQQQLWLVVHCTCASTFLCIHIISLIHLRSNVYNFTWYFDISRHTHNTYSVHSKHRECS